MYPNKQNTFNNIMPKQAMLVDVQPNSIGEKLSAD